jgi:hypothetical protein
VAENEGGLQVSMITTDHVDIEHNLTEEGILDEEKEHQETERHPVEKGHLRAGKEHHRKENRRQFLEIALRLVEKELHLVGKGHHRGKEHRLGENKLHPGNRQDVNRNTHRKVPLHLNTVHHRKIIPGSLSPGGSLQYLILRMNAKYLF